MPVKKNEIEAQSAANLHKCLKAAYEWACSSVVEKHRQFIRDHLELVFLPFLILCQNV